MFLLYKLLKIRINLKINNSNASVRSLFGISKPKDLFNCFCNALLLVANVCAMISCRLRAIPCQVTQQLERATTLRILLKPLLVIPHVGCSCYFKLITILIFSPPSKLSEPYKTISIPLYAVQENSK
jgi:hypothetical protein